MPGPERWMADELDLSGVAWNISGVTTSVPELRGSNLQLPGRDGFIHVPNRSAEPGELTLTMWVLGAETTGAVPGTRSARRQLFERNLHRLLAVMTNRSRPIRIRRYMPGLGYREASCVYTGSTSVQTMMARQRAELSFVFEIEDSYWRSGSPVTDEIYDSASQRLVLTFDEAAGMSAPVLDAVATVRGPCLYPRIESLEADVWVQLESSLAAGETWVVDSGAWTSKKNGVTAAVTHGGHARYIYIAPRAGLYSTPRLDLTAQGGFPNSAAGMSVTFYPRWATL